MLLPMKKINIDNVLNPTLLSIGVLLVFLCGVLQPEYILAIEVLLLVVVTKRIRIGREFKLIALLLVLHTCMCVLLGNDTLLLAAKQLVGIAVSYLFYRTIVNDKQYAIDAIIIYKRFSIAMGTILIMDCGFLS